MSNKEKKPIKEEKKPGNNRTSTKNCYRVFSLWKYTKLKSHDKTYENSQNRYHDIIDKNMFTFETKDEHTRDKVKGERDEVESILLCPRTRPSKYTVKGKKGKYARKYLS